MIKTSVGKMITALLMIGISTFGVFSADAEITFHREDRLISIGSLDEYFNLTTSVSNPAIPPLYPPISTGKTVFSPLLVIHNYKNGLWHPNDLDALESEDPQFIEDKRKESRHTYAHRHVRRAAASFFGLGRIPEGINVTRAANNAESIGKSKVFNGLISKALVSRPGGGFDIVRGIGTYALAVIAPIDNDPDSQWKVTIGATATDPRFQRRFAGAISAMEWGVCLPRPLSMGMFGDDAPAFGRMSGLHEDDNFSPSPAVVRVLSAVYSRIFLAGATSESVIGTRSGIISDISQSGTGIMHGHLRGQHYDFAAGAYLRRRLFKDGEPYSLMEFEDSRIDDTVFFHVASPQYDPQVVDIKTKTGVMVEDHELSSAGGAPLEVAALVRQDQNPLKTISVEQVSGLVTRGSFIVDEKSTAKQSDEAVYERFSTVHIRDVLHLTPRSEPPDPKTGGRELAGTLFFDLDDNVLMIYTLIAANQHGWCRILTEEPALSDVGYATGPAVNVEFQDVNTLVAATGNKTLIEEVYAKPSISLVVSGAYESTGAQFLGSEISFDTYGFATKPALYWRRVGFGTDEMALVKWQEVPPSKLTWINDQLTITFSGPDETFSTTKGTDGHQALRRQVVQVMALRPEDDAAAGFSFYATNIDPLEPQPEPGG